MPTKHERIGVVKDEALVEALESVASILGAAPAATQVHDLAIRGARALQDDEATRNRALQDLVDWSTTGDPPWDREVLAHIDELSSR